MSGVVSRLIQLFRGEPETGTTPAKDPDPLAPDDKGAPEARTLDSLLHLAEVAHAEPLVGNLFRLHFGSSTPAYGRHFIALYSDPDGSLRPIGYLHFTAFENCYLGGGMCMDSRLYRRMPAADRKTLKDAGGVAHFLLKATQQQLEGADALFGYVGDTKAERVDIRSGYVHTAFPRVIVYWPRELPEAEKTRLVEKVAGLGPF